EVAPVVAAVLPELAPILPPILTEIAAVVATVHALGALLLDHGLILLLSAVLARILPIEPFVAAAVGLHARIIGIADPALDRIVVAALHPRLAPLAGIRAHSLLLRLLLGRGRLLLTLRAVRPLLLTLLTPFLARRPALLTGLLGAVLCHGGGRKRGRCRHQNKEQRLAHHSNSSAAAKGGR
ncbi:MAG TPA: hypothetical protein VGB54_06690, partial [Allosphingosinicella sp.]